MKIKLIHLIGSVLVFVQLGYSQNSTKVKALQVGEISPNFSLTNIINIPQKRASLSDYKGKWLILDFWFVNCAPCVSMFPKTDSLQQKFQGRVQFIAINTIDEESKIMNLFSKINNGKGIAYPCDAALGTEDTILSKLFKHKASPHYVWIDPTGTVRAITDFREVTEKNIQTFLNHNIVLPNKYKYEFGDTTSKKTYDFSKPLLIDGNGGSKEDMVFHSIITGPLNISYVGSRFLSAEHLVALQMPISSLYKIAFSQSLDDHINYENRIVPESRIVYELKDSLEYYPLNNESQNNIETHWYDRHVYSYELWVSFFKIENSSDCKDPHSEECKNNQKERLKLSLRKMQSDLNLALPVKGNMEIRKKKCLILICTDSAKLTPSKLTKAIEYDKAYSLNMHNVSISEFLAPFEIYYFWNQSPIIDETHFISKFDISITTTMKDVNKVNLELVKYGLKFIEEERNISMLVLRDSPSK